MSRKALQLRMAGVHDARARAELFSGDGREAVAFALAGRHTTDDREILLVREIVLVPRSAYRERGSHHVTWTTEFLPPVLARAEKHGLSIIKLHSHPSGFSAFSSTDNHADRELFDAIYNWVEHVSIHASVVLLPDRSLIGRGVRADGTFHPFDRTMIVDDRIRIFDRIEEGPVDLPAHSARHALALGGETTRRLRTLRVGVVGYSGTGSFVAEELLRLGVGEVVVVDPEAVEDVNVNRILNSTMDDARARLAKVTLAARTAKAIGIGGSVRPLKLHLAQRDAVLAMAGCDVVFGCVDSHDGRRLLNRIATFYLIPYIDVGVRIDAQAGQIAHISGAVHYLQPGRSSLLSRGVIDAARADAEALRRAHPDIYRERIGEGYIRGGADVTRPAVISINGIFASMAVTELLARLHGFREDDAALAEQRLCLTDGYYSTMGEGDPCDALQPHMGRGDVEPLLDMPSLEER